MQLDFEVNLGNSPPRARTDSYFQDEDTRSLIHSGHVRISRRTIEDQKWLTDSYAR